MARRGFLGCVLEFEGPDYRPCLLGLHLFTAGNHALDEIICHKVSANESLSEHGLLRLAKTPRDAGFWTVCDV